MSILALLMICHAYGQLHGDLAAPTNIPDSGPIVHPSQINTPGHTAFQGDGSPVSSHPHLGRNSIGGLHDEPTAASAPISSTHPFIGATHATAESVPIDSTHPYIGVDRVIDTADNDIGYDEPTPAAEGLTGEEGEHEANMIRVEVTVAESSPDVAQNTVALIVHRSQPIIWLRLKLAQQLAVRPHQLSFQIRGVTLSVDQDDTTLHDLHLQDGAQIQAILTASAPALDLAHPSPQDNPEDPSVSPQNTEPLHESLSEKTSSKAMPEAKSMTALRVVLGPDLNMPTGVVVVHVNADAQVHEALQAVSNKIGVPARLLALAFEGQAMNTEHSMQDYGIPSDAQLSASLAEIGPVEEQNMLEKSIDQYCELRLLTHGNLGLNGRAVMIQVKMHASIGDVKEAISLLEGIPVDELDVAVNGLLRANNDVVAQCMPPESLVEVMMLNPENAQNYAAERIPNVPDSTEADSKTNEVETERKEKLAQIQQHEQEIQETNLDAVETARAYNVEQTQEERKVKKRDLAKWWRDQEEREEKNGINSPSVSSDSEQYDKAVLSAEEVMKKARDKEL